MTVLTFKKTEIKLDNSHIGTRLVVNKRPALVQSLDGRVIAIYRIENERHPIGVTNTPLISTAQVDGVPSDYGASVGFWYPEDSSYSTLDSLLKKELM